MYETLTTPRGPAPFIRVHNPPGPTIARWRIHKSRRKREKEIFQDWRRFPWRGERQAQKGVSLYYRTAVMVDEDVARVPLGQRVANPPSGNYPTVVGVEEGPGPNPWFGQPARFEDVQRRGNNVFGGDFRPRQPFGDKEGPAGPVSLKPSVIPLNEGDYEDGPESRPSIYSAPIPAPTQMADNAADVLRIVTAPQNMDVDAPSTHVVGTQEPLSPESNLANMLRMEVQKAASKATRALANKVNKGKGRRADAQGAGSASNRSPGGAAGHASTLLTSAVQQVLNSDTMQQQIGKLRKTGGSPKQQTATFEDMLKAQMGKLKKTGGPRRKSVQQGGVLGSLASAAKKFASTHGGDIGATIFGNDTSGEWA